MECAIVKRVDLDFAAQPSHSGPHYPVGMRRSSRVAPKSFDLSMSPRLRPQDPAGLSSCTSTASTCAALSVVARQNSDLLLNHDDEPSIQSGLSPCTTSRMLRLMKLLPLPVIRFFSSRRTSSPATAYWLETETSSPCRYRQTFLGDIAAGLIPVEGDIDSRPAGDRCAMVPGRLQAVLDLALAASNSRRQEVRQR